MPSIILHPALPHEKLDGIQGIKPIHWKPADIDPGSLKLVKIVE